MAADETIDYNDKERMTLLVAAMQLMECGVPADMAKVIKGYDMA